MMESERPLVDLEIRDERFFNQPIELRIPPGKVVEHEPLNGVANAGVPVLFHRHSRMVTIFADNGDALVVAMLCQVLQPSFDDVLGDDRLLHHCAWIVRHDDIHMKVAIYEISAKK